MLDYKLFCIPKKQLFMSGQIFVNSVVHANQGTQETLPELGFR